MQPSVNTRIPQSWTAIPFITSTIFIICAIIYVVCLLVGYDSFEQVCFLPVAISSHYEVYRPYTATLFHVSVLHLLFNMLALVPISSGLERILGSVRYSHLLFLIATSNGILHLFIAAIIAHNPFHPYNPIMNQCSIGFSGMIFAMIVMETSLSGAQTRSIFGLFNVPAKWYAWILLILFQILMPNVSLLGHLCGILSGFAYTYGLFNPLQQKRPPVRQSSSSSIGDVGMATTEASNTVASPRRTLSVSHERASVVILSEGEGDRSKQGAKPTEVYGFVGSISTIVGTVLFFGWAYLPESWLYSTGITYYPSRYWAVALPAYAVMVIVFISVVYTSLNYITTIPPDSWNSLCDEFTRPPVTSTLSDFFQDERPIDPISDIPITEVNLLMFGVR